MKLELSHLLYEHSSILKKEGINEEDALDFFLTLLLWEYFERVKDCSENHYKKFSELSTLQTRFKHYRSDLKETFTKNISFSNEDHQKFNNLFLSNKTILKKIEPSLLANLFEEFYKKFDNWNWSKDNILELFSMLELFFIKKNKSTYDFFTPTEIVRLIANLLEITVKGSLYDPFCRAGDFLSYITAKNQGIQATGMTKNIIDWKIAQSKCILLSTNANIIQGDIYNISVDQKFDYITSNPPFGSAKINYSAIDQASWLNSYCGISSETDYLCHVLDRLNETGQAAIIMPVGFLSAQGKKHLLRKDLIEKNLIEAVILLPEKVFYATKSKTIILLLNKKKKNEKILIINAKDFGSQQRDRRILSEQDNNLIIQAVKSSKNLTFKDEDLFYQVTINTIRDNNYNLSSSVSEEDAIRENIRSSKEILSEIGELTQELSTLEYQLDKIIKKNF